MPKIQSIHMHYSEAPPDCTLHVAICIAVATLCMYCIPPLSEHCDIST